MPEVADNTTDEKPKRGRPVGSTKLQLDDELIKQIQGLARIQCTMKEAGAVLGVNEVTFSLFLKAHKKAMEAWDYGKENGKASLRRYQFKTAETNPTMQIWLGKQMLDQVDKSESHVTSDNRHLHKVDAVSKFDEFLAEASGAGTEGDTAESVPN